MHTKCSDSGKIKYEQEGDALAAALRTTTYSGRPIWHYVCPECSSWHITGMSQKKYKAIQRRKEKLEHEAVGSDGDGTYRYREPSCSHSVAYGPFPGPVRVRFKSCCMEHALSGVPRMSGAE